MTARGRKLVLGLLLGGMWKSWKHTDGHADEVLKLSLHRELARQAESAKGSILCFSLTA